MAKKRAASARAAGAAYSTSLRSLLASRGFAAGVALVATAVYWFARHGGPPAGPAEPEVYGYRIKATYPHDVNAFTQGLLILNGSLYESTGLFGRSEVRRVEPETGQVLQSFKLSQKDFGEGLVALKHDWGHELLQLLWRTGRGWRYNLSSDGKIITPGRAFRTPLRDGWGIEQLPSGDLVATDSGPYLYFLDADGFRLKEKRLVTDNGKAVLMVNELEMINGSIWANIYGKDCLARINPSSGAVTAWAIVEGLQEMRGDKVLNGIAWDAERGRLFITGKLWPALYEVELVPSTVSLSQARQKCLPSKTLFPD